MYEDLGLPYRTPTVGLFFFAPCYMRFVKNLKDAIASDMRFVEKSRYDKANRMRSENYYPVGVILGDIEIHFLHYHSEAEALEKWNRRRERINFDNLFFSFSDSEGYDIDELKSYDNLPYTKVFFSAKKITGVKSAVWLKQFRNRPHIGDIYTYRWSYRKYFDVIPWLNKRP